MLGTMALCACALGLVPWWCALALVAGAMAAFSTFFRRELNAAMGWNADYLGSTSVYDLWMIALQMFLEYGRWPKSTAIAAVHQSMYALNPAYAARIHRAGRLATGLEMGCAGVAVLCCIVAGLAPAF
jgi:hypothetical protein